MMLERAVDQIEFEMPEALVKEATLKLATDLWELEEAKREI